MYVKYPPQLKLPILDFKSVGLIIQHEDYSILRRTSFQIFTTNTIIETKKYSFHIGLNTGLFTNGLNTSGMSLSELTDGELIQVDGSAAFISRLGFSYITKNHQLGVASGINSITGLGDITATARTQVNFRNSKFRLMPALIYRLSSNTKSQMEVQARIVYDKKLALTVGYRQEFGPLLQLGLLINTIKASYGSELPSGGNASMGMTHEILMSYSFKLVNAKKLERDSLLRKQKDSLNIVRLDSLRKARLIQHQIKPAKEEPENTLAEPVNADSLANEKTAANEALQADSGRLAEDIISFENIPRHIEKDHTHVIMDHIGFEAGYDILKPYAYQELDKLVSYLKHNKKFKLEIQGHTDNSGSAESNYELSYRRALIVYNYLISRGIDPEKMTVAGYGEERPLRPNDTEENRKLNRRIEIVFVKDSTENK